MSVLLPEVHIYQPPLKKFILHTQYLLYFEYLSFHILCTDRCKTGHPVSDFCKNYLFYGCLHNVVGIRSSLKKGIKKQFAPTENTSIKTNCSLISTNYIFLKLDDFAKSSSLSEIKARAKINFNSICTPPGNSEVPQVLYLRAFSAFLSVIQTLGRRDLSGCFLVHICVFYSSYSSNFAFLCTSAKIFRAKIEPGIRIKI